MRVDQLIEVLQKMPPDALVLHLWDGEVRTAIEHVWIDRVGNVVTADNNMVCYSTEARPADAPTASECPYWHTPRL